MYCYDDLERCCPCGCGSSTGSTSVVSIPRYIAGPQGPQGEPGVVTPAAAVADLVATDATVAEVAATVNEILAALRAAGLMET